MNFSMRLHDHVVACLGCALLGLSLLLSIPSYGQVVGATLNGTVTDSSGAAIPNAKILIKDVATGVARDTTTDTTGYYTAPNLLPGRYEVTASAPGFSTLIQSGISLTVGAQQSLNLTLQVGQVSQEVKVTSEAMAVQLTSSSLSNEINETTVRELPLNGRDWTQLATLQPGVASMSSIQPGLLGTTAGSAKVNRGFGTRLTISGGRPEQNNYRVDGISVNDYESGSPSDALGVSLGVDAIQEFSVVSSNYSAEYGRTSGGVINAITRSGTNEFHGDAYEFIRNSALDARNFFDGSKIAPFRRNQFGVAAGAPIKKDKTFIFVDYEGLRQSLGITTRANVPSDTARTGLLHYTTSPPAGCTPVSGTTNQCTVPVDPVVASFLALYHLPTAGLLGAGDTGVYSFVRQQIASENYITARIDHHFSDKDSLFGVYQFDTSQTLLPDPLNVVVTGSPATNQRFAAEETHIFSPRFINSVRFGFNRVNDVGGVGISAVNPAATNTALGAVPGLDAGQTIVSGLTTLTGGLNDQSNVSYRWNSFQEYDDANLTVGKQNIKFGVDVQHDQENTLNQVGFGGGFIFGSLSALLQNVPTSFNITFPPVAARYFRQTMFGGYIQDDVRWRPTLTINLGLRYEMLRVPTETGNRLSNLRTLTAATQQLGSPLFDNPTLRNFAPRVGFAWDPFGNGKTSVRGGFGIFDVLPLLWEYQLNLGTSYPFTLSGQATTLPQFSFPSGALGIATSVPLQHANYTQFDPKRNYVMQWNFNVQREIASGLTVMAAYLGSHSLHNSFVQDDPNTVLPTLTPAGYLWPCGPPAVGSNPCTLGHDASGGTSLQQNPNFGRISGIDWTDFGIYHSFEGQVTKRMSRGFQIQGSFTWAKAIDGGTSGASLAQPYSNSLPNPFFFEPQFNRGLADYNVKDNLVINSTWTAPKPNFANKIANYALGGWELGGIFNARTGLPFSVLIGGDALTTRDSTPLDVPNRLTGTGCDTAVNSGQRPPLAYINTSCFGLPMSTPAIAAQCSAFKSAAVSGTCQNLQGNATRNGLVGPGLIDFDFSLFKNNYIGHSERVNAQFRTEFFNIFNRANFNSPNNNRTIFNADGSATAGAGLLDSTSTTAREIQFALKLIW